MRIELAAAMRRIPVRQEGIGVSNQANLTSQRDCDTWRQKVQQLARVRNPNFLNVLDVIFDKSSDFVITERPRGHSLNATHMLSAIFERSITMKNLLILLICFAFICTVRATDISDLIIEGLPVKVLSSGKSYKVFEQYPWEGHSSKYGPKGNRLDSSYGVGVGKNISRSLQLRHGDWIPYAGHRLAAD